MLFLVIFIALFVWLILNNTTPENNNNNNTSSNSKAIQSKDVNKSVTINPRSTIIDDKAIDSTENPVPNNQVTNNLDQRVLEQKSVDNLSSIKRQVSPVGTDASNASHASHASKASRVSTLTVRQVFASPISTDDEVNSNGSYTDDLFDIRSGSSTTDSIDSVDSVRVIQNKPIVNERINNIAVIDVCSYSDSVIFLLDNGYIIVEQNNVRRTIRTNVKLRRIISFSGYIYGIGQNQKLYVLPHFSHDNWQFQHVDWAPEKLIHISITHSSSYLWLQTDTTGYLYDTPGTLLSEMTYHGRRIYGRDLEHYIDLDVDKHTIEVHPTLETKENVYDAALSYYDDVLVIDVKDSDKFIGIAMVNWKPYYISK